MAIAAAYPFIDVRIDTSGLAPVVQRAPGVIAVVGKTNAGEAPDNTPLVVSSPAEALTLFAAPGKPTPSLAASLLLALLQDPQPSKVYGLRVKGDDYAAALEGADDVRFVALAAETSVTTAGSDTKDKPGPLLALKDHVERLSSAGQKMLGVAMVDPARSRTPSYAADVIKVAEPLRSDVSRMVVVAARGATGDAATAAMSAMAAYAPHVSLVLNPVRGLGIPQAAQYGPRPSKAL